MADLPAHATIEMIGPAALKAVTLGIGDSGARGPAAFDLQRSEDGAVWSRVQAWTGQVWPAAKMRRTYPVTVTVSASRFWRCAVLGAGTRRLGIDGEHNLRLHAVVED